MKLELDKFDRVCEIIPKLDANNEAVEFFPQSRYKKQHLGLHKYGKGPFCKFTIGKQYFGKIGVYVILVNNEVCYVGECEISLNDFTLMETYHQKIVSRVDDQQIVELIPTF